VVDTHGQVVHGGDPEAAEVGRYAGGQEPALLEGRHVGGGVALFPSLALGLAGEVGGVEIGQLDHTAASVGDRLEL
jgi:hypothetical protein